MKSNEFSWDRSLEFSPCPGRPNSITARVWFCKLLFLFFLAGCAPPDLKDRETYETALREAEPMGKLTHKRMYGMIMLYVDENDEPYTGWVKKEWGKRTNQGTGIPRGRAKTRNLDGMACKGGEEIRNSLGK